MFYNGLQCTEEKERQRGGKVVRGRDRGTERKKRDRDVAIEGERERERDSHGLLGKKNTITHKHTQEIGSTLVYS